MADSDRTQETSISKARSYEQIGDYWDSHSVADVWEQTHDVEFEIRVPRGRSLRVHSPHFVNPQAADEFVMEVIDKNDEEQ